MTDIPSPGPADADGFWLDHPDHRAYLARDARRQFEFFRASLRDAGGFHSLAHDGSPLPGSVQELHSTTRMIHSYVLGKLAGVPDCDAMIDQGMRYLTERHRDTEHGGYLWALDDGGIQDDRKLAYGHVFVLLAGSAAKLAGHPGADALIADATRVLDERFWEEEPGLFADEWNRDWTPFSNYRGMNANMHGVEALLAAYEATGRERYLEQAGRILDFFMNRMAPAEDWRLPEHYNADWTPDRTYSGNPMFRPAGTTPGHSFELSRLMIQHWDLAGRPDTGAPRTARKVVERALLDGWDKDRGGVVYTLKFDGTVSVDSRYWWPVTEAIGVLATLIKLDRAPGDEVWYRKLWEFADAHFVDHERGGWFPEIDATGKPTAKQFHGKPDIYHALQAAIYPLSPRISNMAGALPAL